MRHYLLVIDQGTTSTRAIVFDKYAQPVAAVYRELPQSYPHEGWVEHSPQTIWADVLAVSQEVLEKANLSAEHIAGIGISNQRETTIIWDKMTGEPIYPAIVWQDRRTTALCELWLAEGLTDMVAEKTGLLLDPYFSASKIRWIMDNVAGAKQRAMAGELLFGTIDTYLVWMLTGGQSHVTDATNASRTLLYNIHTQDWDPALLDAFDVPASLLSTVLDNAADFGIAQASFLGAPIPIVALAGDQQAALIGQACFNPGMMKATFGTGCFMLLNTGNKPLVSTHRLLSTIAYRLNGHTIYALEGSIFVAGAALQWLRDAVKLIDNAADSEKIAMEVDDTEGVYLVPAFTGLGAPYWDPKARGAILGLTRNSGVAHIVRATLESVCYQCRDLWLAMQADGASELHTLRVDGGMVINDWLMQFLSDILRVTVERPQQTETTARGVALLAGIQLGWYADLDAAAELWDSDRVFKPEMPAQRQQTLYVGWLESVRKIRTVG